MKIRSYQIAQLIKTNLSFRLAGDSSVLAESLTDMALKSKIPSGLSRGLNQVGNTWVVGAAIYDAHNASKSLMDGDVGGYISSAASAEINLISLVLGNATALAYVGVAETSFLVHPAAGVVVGGLAVGISVAELLANNHYDKIEAEKTLENFWKDAVLWSKAENALAEGGCN
jgi:hypothetical protein